MKVDVLTVGGVKRGSISLPIQFYEPVREDLIKRAVLAIQSRKYQPYGADPSAGTRQGKATPKRRNKYKTVYGIGVSRVKRKSAYHRGTRFNWTAAFIASARGGRKAFPPKAEKVIVEKINDKERRKAIRSAIAAAQSIFVEDKIERVSKTKELKDMLRKLGLKDELARCEVKKIRAGRGKTRGRKYRRKVGPLVVVSKKNCDAIKSAKNIAGVDVINVSALNAELLAPGTQPGRRTIWSKSSVEVMEKGRLFV